MSGTHRPRVHVSIDVPDLEAGLSFYAAVFGFAEKTRPFPTMAIVDGNNVTVCIHEKTTGSRSSSGSDAQRHYQRHWTPVHLDLHVHDFEAAVARVRAAGGSVENELDHGPKQAAFCSDPFGNGFCIIGE